LISRGWSKIHIKWKPHVRYSNASNRDFESRNELTSIKGLNLWMFPLPKESLELGTFIPLVNILELEKITSGTFKFTNENPRERFPLVKGMLVEGLIIIYYVDIEELVSPLETLGLVGFEPPILDKTPTFFILN
jgi:hypothetical protein